MADAAEKLGLMTREEFLSREEQSVVKHEFFQGEIFAMSGGTYHHADISGNIYADLKGKLRGRPCRPMNSDMRIQTPSGLDTYPDVSVFCGKPELRDEQRTLLNPVVIVEVLSPSTRTYDRGDKFALYRAIPTLRDYLLVDSEQILVEHFRRGQDNEWVLREYRALADSIPLTAIAHTMRLETMYEGIAWNEGRGLA